MTVIQWLAAIIAILLVCYLSVALMFPEKFS